MENAAELESQLVESLSSVSTIKRFNLENYSNLKTESRFVNFLQPVYKSGLNNIFSSTSSGLVSQLITIVLLWTGAGFVLKSIITPGELLSFYTIVGYFTGPVSSIIGFNRTLQDARIASDRLFEIFDLEIEEESNKIGLRSDMLGDIHFENVSFRYGTRVDVFDSFNIDIKKGDLTAIVGESGSGKTTLVSLLQRIYPVQKGVIKIGSYDIANVSNATLRQIISVVPQTIDIFAGNILENIALGELIPDMERFFMTIEKLGMTKFIEEMPNGYLTYVGEKGVSLSGGQKQRIGIARALYRDPEILIFDEATSSMDSVSEEFVQQAIKTLAEEGKTVIVIAHRLSTIKLAQRIIVLEKGMIIQDGTFLELSTSKGLFQKMWAIQTNSVQESVK